MRNNYFLNGKDGKKKCLKLTSLKMTRLFLSGLFKTRWRGGFPKSCIITPTARFNLVVFYFEIWSYKSRSKKHVVYLLTLLKKTISFLDLSFLDMSTISLREFALSISQTWTLFLFIFTYVDTYNIGSGGDMACPQSLTSCLN